RRSAQTAMWHIAETLTRLVAPILSFTAEEVWQSLPKVENREASVHLALFPALSEIVPTDTTDLLQKWTILLEIRDLVLKQLEIQRNEKVIGKSLGAFVELEPHTNRPDFIEALKMPSEQLAELFNVSRVHVQPYSSNPDYAAPLIVLVGPMTNTPQCARCWRHVSDVGDEANYPTVCLRCAEALDAIEYPAYTAAPTT
ncbi:MAG TPA: class I tRNA ligase family protein, partial [Edaphobacter sp.]